MDPINIATAQQLEAEKQTCLVEKRRSRAYLDAHPAFECQLWRQWVLTVCQWRSIAPPTGKEWDLLMANWTGGKAPLASVDELEKLRAGALR